MENKFPIREHLTQISPYKISGTINILIATVTSWLSKVNLSIPGQRLEEKLRKPNGKLQELLHAGVDFSSRKAQISYAAGLYKQRLTELIHSSKPAQRNTAIKLERLSSDELERISAQIAEHALQYPFEEGLDFLAKLTQEWITTCSEDIIRQDITFAQEHWDEKIKNSEDMNELLLRWIVMAFPY